MPLYPTESDVVNQWMKQGGDERELQTRQEDLLVLLQERFPGTVPEDVIQTVKQQPSRELLSTWFERAITIPTIDEFRTYLRR